MALMWWVLGGFAVPFLILEGYKQVILHRMPKRRADPPQETEHSNIVASAMWLEQ